MRNRRSATMSGNGSGSLPRGQAAVAFEREHGSRCMGCCNDAGAPGHARGPTRHRAALSVRLPRAMAGSARIGFSVAAGRGADNADSSADRTRDGSRAATGVRVAVVPVGGFCCDNKRWSGVCVDAGARTPAALRSCGAFDYKLRRIQSCAASGARMAFVLQSGTRGDHGHVGGNTGRAGGCRRKHS